MKLKKKPNALRTRAVRYLVNDFFPVELNLRIKPKSSFVLFIYTLYMKFTRQFKTVECAGNVQI